MISRPVFLLAAFMQVNALPAGADALLKASQDLCEKVKACAMSQMAEEELTPEVREMMQPMLDNMCVNMQDKVSEVPAGHPMYAPATKCMSSMATLSCEEMMNSGEANTPECEAYRKLAEETYDNP